MLRNAAAIPGIVPSNGRFRCMLSTENELRAVSRRGWDMSNLLPKFGAFRCSACSTASWFAFDSNGSPDLPLVCERMLMRRTHIPVVYVIFDLLSLDGRSLMGEAYRELALEMERESAINRPRQPMFV